MLSKIGIFENFGPKLKFFENYNIFFTKDEIFKKIYP